MASAAPAENLSVSLLVRAGEGVQKCKEGSDSREH